MNLDSIAAGIISLRSGKRVQGKTRNGPGVSRKNESFFPGARGGNPG